jgi:hypothetical protein
VKNSQSIRKGLGRSNPSPSNSYAGAKRLSCRLEDSIVDAVVEVVEAAVVERRDVEEDSANIRATIVEEDAVVEVVNRREELTVAPDQVALCIATVQVAGHSRTRKCGERGPTTVSAPRINLMRLITQTSLSLAVPGEPPSYAYSTHGNLQWIALKRLCTQTADFAKKRFKSVTNFLHFLNKA